MRLRLHRAKRPGPQQPPDADEQGALKNARQYADEHGHGLAIVKKMGRENLDGPFARD